MLPLKSFSTFLFCLSAGLVLGVNAAHAQSCDALVDALVQKKVLSAHDADTIRADLIHEPTSAQKLKLDNCVSQLSLYGDLRLRYEGYNLDPQLDKGASGNPGHGSQSSRLRFRLRLNADFKLTENWFGGVMLTTSKNPDTGSQSFTGGFQNYDIYVSRAFVGWKNSDDWFTVIGGKMPSPFYSTDMVWDPNINPSGFYEQIKFHTLFGDGAQDTGGHSKDAKAAAASAGPWEVSLQTAQFYADDNSEDAASGMNTDAWLFQEQLQVSYKFNKNVKLTVAPGYLTYNAAQINDASNVAAFAKSTDSLSSKIQETRYLSLVQIPGDVSFKIGGLATKFFWDFTYNTDGEQRVRDIYQLDGTWETTTNSAGKVVSKFQRSEHSARDDYGWQVGFLFGQNAKKGDLSLFVSYRQVGLASVDPNLTCSDFALSRVNVRGFKVSLAYNLSNAAVFQVTWFGADNLRHDLYGGQATGGARIADGNNIQLVTVDLNVKF